MLGVELAACILMSVIHAIASFRIEFAVCECTRDECTRAKNMRIFPFNLFTLFRARSRH